VTRLERLCALRDRLTERVESGDVQDALLPQMVGVLSKLLAEIEACEKAEPEQKGTVLDELAKRREAASPGRAAGS